MTKKSFLSKLFAVRPAVGRRSQRKEAREKGHAMDAIIDEALCRLKGRVVEIAEEFTRKGLSPGSLSSFEHKLHESLGEFGRKAETAVLERADVETGVIEHGGARHYWKYKGPQEYQCLFGKIEVRRSVYQANGDCTLCPLEVNGGIVHHHLTPAAAEFVAFFTAHMVPAEVEKFCRKWQYLQPCETVIKQVAAEVGEMAEVLQEHYEEEVHKQEGPPPEGTKIVSISRDGTCVNTREDGWRQAQVGAITSYAESTEVDEDGDPIRKRLRTTYLGQMPEEASETFNPKFEQEIDHVLDRVEHGCDVVCLADGALSNWTYFEAHPRLKHTTHINDFYHAADHLNDVFQALFGQGTAEAKRWFEKYRRILKKEDGGVERVIRSIRYLRSSRGPRSAESRKTIADNLKFFTRNRSRMNYAEYRRRGLPIGSGVVEAACKTVIGHRFKRAGMRWSIEGGQDILNLRVLVLSSRWEAFWNCHEQTLAASRVAA
jgi:hypothetical protein